MNRAENVALLVFERLRQLPYSRCQLKLMHKKETCFLREKLSDPVGTSHDDHMAIMHWKASPPQHSTAGVGPSALVVSTWGKKGHPLASNTKSA